MNLFVHYNIVFNKRNLLTILGKETLNLGEVFSDAPEFNALGGISLEVRWPEYAQIVHYLI